MKLFGNKKSKTAAVDDPGQELSRDALWLTGDPDMVRESEQDFAILFNDASGILDKLKEMAEHDGSGVEYGFETVDGPRHQDRHLHIWTNIPVSRHKKKDPDTFFIDVALLKDGFNTSVMALGDDKLRFSEPTTAFDHSLDNFASWFERERITQPRDVINYAVQHAIDAGLITEAPKPPKL